MEAIVIASSQFSVLFSDVVSRGVFNLFYFSVLQTVLNHMYRAPKLVVEPLWCTLWCSVGYDLWLNANIFTLVRIYIYICLRKNRITVFNLVRLNRMRGTYVREFIDYKTTSDWFIRSSSRSSPDPVSGVALCDRRLKDVNLLWYGTKRKHEQVELEMLLLEAAFITAVLLLSGTPVVESGECLHSCAHPLLRLMLWEGAFTTNLSHVHALLNRVGLLVCAMSISVSVFIHESFLHMPAIFACRCDTCFLIATMWKPPAF